MFLLCYRLILTRDGDRIVNVNIYNKLLKKKKKV